MQKNLSFPIWVTNFKSYDQSVGPAARKLTQIHADIAMQYHANIGVSPNILDLQRVAQDYINSPLLICAQHVSGYDAGAHTGEVIAQHIADNGCGATLINHSEHRLSWTELQKAHQEAKAAGLLTIICAANPEEVQRFAELKPDAVAYEPPELIGSKDKSVSSENPELITKSVQLAGDVPLLVGAGVSTTHDIQIALRLGAKGFLVASGIVKATDPAKALSESIQAMQKA